MDMTENISLSARRGDFNQSNERFSMDNRGNQCVANCAMYFIYSLKKTSDKITSLDINKMLEYGDELYSQI